MIIRLWFKTFTLINFRERSGIERVNGHTEMSTENAIAGVSFNGVLMKSQGHKVGKWVKGRKCWSVQNKTQGLWQGQALISKIVLAFLVSEQNPALLTFVQIQLVSYKGRAVRVEISEKGSLNRT